MTWEDPEPCPLLVSTTYPILVGDEEDGTTGLLDQQKDDDKDKYKDNDKDNDSDLGRPWTLPVAGQYHVPYLGEVMKKMGQQGAIF